MSTTTAPTTALVNIEIEEGTDYNLKINYTDPSTGLPIDLTGYSAEMFVDADIGDSGALRSFSTGNSSITLSGVDGIITLTISASSTNGLGLFKGFYNLYLVKIAPPNERTKISKGFFIVSPSVF